MRAARTGPATASQPAGRPDGAVGPHTRQRVMSSDDATTLCTLRAGAGFAVEPHTTIHHLPCLHAYVPPVPPHAACVRASWQRAARHTTPKPLEVALPAHAAQRLLCTQCSLPRFALAREQLAALPACHRQPAYLHAAAHPQVALWQHVGPAQMEHSLPAAPRVRGGGVRRGVGEGEGAHTASVSLHRFTRNDAMPCHARLLLMMNLWSCTLAVRCDATRWQGLLPACRSRPQQPRPACPRADRELRAGALGNSCCSETHVEPRQAAGMPPSPACRPSICPHP